MSTPDDLADLRRRLAACEDGRDSWKATAERLETVAQAARAWAQAYQAWLSAPFGLTAETRARVVLHRASRPLAAAVAALDSAPPAKEG